MKRFAVFTVAVLSAMLLASCYVMTTRPTGTIQLNLGTASSRAIDGATADRARIYLYS